VPEYQGDSEFIAKEKVKFAYQKAQKAVIVEDTALCFNAYHELPGPYVKWFLKAIGPEGLAKMVEPYEDKTGFAMCTIAYMSPELK
jgi:inosine triphosphate pyrophosphatase